MDLLKSMLYRLSVNRVFKNLKGILPQQALRQPKLEKSLSGRYIGVWSVV